ncbi:hypothetical protein NM688_g7026 [Phlebia brevispora]|uniref:Uncharacterized protein n=1 Tax=Phlebia brevispora TaxID=194682 RepID=A0ACC1S9Z3_9APHY|nr:hypothetical protein NM688_g7026 [Phlebia brevispora]
MFYCDPNSDYCYAYSIDDDMTIDTTIPKDTPALALRPEDVPLREGPPTREEMLIYYPGKFTWEQLKTFINSG